MDNRATPANIVRQTFSLGGTFNRGSKYRSATRTRTNINNDQLTELSVAVDLSTRLKDRELFVEIA